MIGSRGTPPVERKRAGVRALVVVAVALLAAPGAASAQNETMLRTALEGKVVVVKIDMPATSRGVEVYPLDAMPLNYRELAQRIKDNGTAIRMGQQVMVTKVVVKKDSHIEFQLGGGGYGTFGDSDGSSVSVVAAGETKAEKMLRDSIRVARGPTTRKRFERELESLRSERQRENARAAAEAQQAQAAREANLRIRRLDAGSRFNIRFHEGIPADVLTPEGVMRALAAYVDFPGSANADSADPPAPANSLTSLRKGLLLEEVEALLGPATTANEVKEGSLTVLRRTYRKNGMRVAASFVNDVLIDWTITSE